MPKLPYKNRFVSFKNSICPYCEGKATLSETTIEKYSGQCLNPECRAHNHFTNKKCKDWINE